jgi:hypothetical protein
MPPRREDRPHRGRAALRRSRDEWGSSEATAFTVAGANARSCDAMQHKVRLVAAPRHKRHGTAAGGFGAPALAAAAGGAPQLDALRSSMLDLERRVREAEALAEEPLELETDAVTVGSRSHEHVRRE